MFYHIKEWNGTHWCGTSLSNLASAITEFNFSDSDYVYLLKVDAEPFDADIPEEKMEFVRIRFKGQRVLKFYQHKTLGCYCLGDILIVENKYRAWVDAGGLKDYSRDFDTLEEAEQHLIKQGFALEWTDETYMKEVNAIWQKTSQ